MARRSTALLLRRSLPLLSAAAVFFVPGTAVAGSPAPDPSGAAAAAAPAPDPAPVAPFRAAPVQAPAAPLVTPAATARALAVRPHAVQPKPVTKKHRRSRPVARPRPAHAETPLADVAPVLVDVPRGLGAIATSVRDDPALLLAGAALLIAASVAASGAGLALVAARAQRRIE